MVATDQTASILFRELMLAIDMDCVTQTSIRSTNRTIESEPLKHCDLEGENLIVIISIAIIQSIKRTGIQLYNKPPQWFDSVLLKGYGKTFSKESGDSPRPGVRHLFWFTYPICSHSFLNSWSKTPLQWHKLQIRGKTKMKRKYT